MRRLALMLCLLAAPAGAQSMPHGQVKTILEATRANWIAIRLHDGQDLLYFTHLESWRCGIAAVGFGVNGGAPVITYALPPCDPANPNAIPEGHLPYVTAPAEMLQSVTVKVTFPDGTSATQSYMREDVSID